MINKPEISLDTFFNQYNYVYIHTAPRNTHTSRAKRMFSIGSWHTRQDAIKNAVRCLRRFGGNARVYHMRAPEHNFVWKRGTFT